MKLTICSGKGNYLELVCICVLFLLLSSCVGGGGGGGSAASSSGGGVVISGSTCTVAELDTRLPTLAASENFSITNAKTFSDIITISLALGSLKTTQPSVSVGLDFTPSTGLTSLPNYAFFNCTNVSSINLPSSVTTIGDCAFQGCTGLSNITIPSSVTTIGGYAFYGCTGFNSITIPSSVTEIGDVAFHGCTNLTTVTFQGSTPPPTIGTDIFDGCSKLTTIKVPSGAKSAYETALAGKLPAGVTITE